MAKCFTYISQKYSKLQPHNFMNTFCTGHITDY